MKSSFVWLGLNLPVFISALVLLGLSALFSGCYTIKQGTAMLSYLGRAVPLEKLGEEGGAQDDSAVFDDRHFVKRVEDIRRFAIEELGLKESKNYTRYVELDRDYLAAVVSASAKDSFTRHEWRFPVVGSVPYKGFFSVEDARKERAKLEKKDLDVWIRGVEAFSTLGWFRDPLYSYMKKYSDQALADLIIHELLHATVYIKSHSGFNEQLAEFVGTEGARLYVEKITGHEEVSEDNLKEDRAAFISFIQGLIAELDTMYKSNISREEKLIRKEEIIKAAKISFDENYAALFKTENYRSFSTIPVNNAYLDLYRLYHAEDNYFISLYERSGSNLRKFIDAAKTLSKTRRQDPKEEFEKALGLR